MTLFFDSDKSREWLPQILFFTILSLSLIIHNLKHQNRVFRFYHLNSKFWVFEWWKQTSKTKPNIASFVEPTSFGWWIMKTEWYHSIFGPSKQALRHSSPSFHHLSLKTGGSYGVNTCLDLFWVFVFIAQFSLN